MRELTMGSLFDGIGGFPLAAIRSGITPVWASEIEAFPIAVTKLRFPDMLHVGDKLPFRTQLPNEIAGAGFHLLMERYRWDKPIRAVTIRGIDLVSQKEAEQLSMFVDHQKRDRRILLEDAVEDIRRRFGKRAISYAILMGDLKIPDDDRQLVTMPGLMYQ